MYNKQIIDEGEMADIIFSLNKRAKNMRDKQRNIVYKKNNKLTKSNKGKIKAEIADLKEKKFEFYEQKDLLLSTYFEPICIHKQTLTTKNYEYLSNMKYVDLNSFMQLNFGKYFSFNFLNEKYQKKPKTIEINGRKIKTNCYYFNNIITNEELILDICNEIDRKIPNILVKGTKIYIPYFSKTSLFKELDFIFVKNLWNGKHIEKPKYFKKILEFGNIKISRKTNIIDSADKYYLFYKIDNHSFHKPINISELNNYPNLEIKEVKLDTKGEDVSELIKDDIVQKELNKINIKNNL